MTFRLLRALAGLSVLALLLCASSCRRRALNRWAWIDGKLSGPDLPFTCTAPLEGASIALDCEALPKDTVITVRGTEHAAAGKLHLDVDVGEALGSVTVKDLLSPGFELDPKIPIVITIPSGTVKTEVPKLKYLTIPLKYAAGKPLAFGKEPPPAPNKAGTTVLWFGLNDEAFGPAATLREVDWLAVQGDVKIVDGPTCKYQDTQTGKISSAPLKLHAPEIVIYDRRTARVIDRKVFSAGGSCPSEKSKQDDTVHAGASEDTIKRWLKERRTKP
jgi:hypothetical protein